MASPSFKPGKALLTLVSFVTVIGPYIADWKYEQHPTFYPSYKTNPRLAKPTS